MGKPTLGLLTRDLTQLGLPSSTFSIGLVSDETSYNYNPDRYTFYQQILSDISDPDQNISAKVFRIFARNRRQQERIEENINNIASAISYLKSVYKKQEMMGGYQLGPDELDALEDDINSRLLANSIINKEFEFKKYTNKEIKEQGVPEEPLSKENEEIGQAEEAGKAGDTLEKPAEAIADKGIFPSIVPSTLPYTLPAPTAAASSASASSAAASSLPPPGGSGASLPPGGSGASPSSLLPTSSHVDQIVDDTKQWTALHRAVVNNNKTDVIQLLSVGANVNVKDSLKNTPLNLAVANNNAEIVELLLADPGVDVNAMDENGKTPLHVAALNGFIEIVNLLLAAPGIEVNFKTPYHETPLHFAAWNGRDVCVQALLDAPGIELNAKTLDKWTPLNLAAANGHEACVRLLLAAPGIEVNTPNRFGDTPLLWAVAKRHAEIVKLLLAAPGVDVNANTENGETPLSIAIENGYSEIIKEIQEKLEAEKLEAEKLEIQAINTNILDPPTGYFGISKNLYFIYKISSLINNLPDYLQILYDDINRLITHITSKQFVSQGKKTYNKDKNDFKIAKGTINNELSKIVDAITRYRNKRKKDDVDFQSFRSSLLILFTRFNTLEQEYEKETNYRYKLLTSWRQILNEANILDYYEKYKNEIDTLKLNAPEIPQPQLQPQPQPQPLLPVLGSRRSAIVSPLPQQQPISSNQPNNTTSTSNEFLSDISKNILKIIFYLLQYKFRDKRILDNGEISELNKNGILIGKDNKDNKDDLNDHIVKIIYNAIINPTTEHFIYSDELFMLNSSIVDKILQLFMQEIYRNYLIIYPNNNNKQIFYYTLKKDYGSFSIRWVINDTAKIQIILRGILINMILDTEYDAFFSDTSNNINNLIAQLLFETSGNTSTFNIQRFRKDERFKIETKNMFFKTTKVSYSYTKFINTEDKYGIIEFKSLRNLFREPKPKGDATVYPSYSPILGGRTLARGGGWEELKHIGGSYFSEKLNELSKIGQQSLTAKQREAEEEDVIVEYKNNPMFSPDNEKVTFTDRIVFIATTFAFRAIALMLLNSAIHTRYITKFTQAFGYYFMIYSLLFVIWIAIVNIQQDNRLVGLLFYYVNTRYDSSIWFSRIGLHLVLQLLILPMPILLTPKFSSQSETDTFEQREHLYNTLTFFTFIIWFITSLIALRA